SPRGATRAQQPISSNQDGGRGDTASGARRTRGKEPAAMLYEVPQAVTQLLGGQPARDLAVERNGDLSGLLGYDDSGCIALFGQTDRRAVPRTQIAAEPRVDRQRQKTRGRRDPALLKNHSAVVQRGARPKNRDEQIVGQRGIERNAALDVVS